MTATPVALGVYHTNPQLGLRLGLGYDGPTNQLILVAPPAGRASLADDEARHLQDVREQDLCVEARALNPSLLEERRRPFEDLADRPRFAQDGAPTCFFSCSAWK